MLNSCFDHKIAIIKSGRCRGPNCAEKKKTWVISQKLIVKKKKTKLFNKK